MAMGESDVAFMQQSLKDPNLPSELRIGFIKKVYGLVISMLLVSFGVATPFVFFTDQTMKFLNQNPWIPMAVAALFLVHLVVNLAITFEACCGGGQCTQAYLRMFVKVPINYCFLFTYAGAFGVVVGYTCSTFQVSSVVLAFLLTAGIVFVLSIYAACTRSDFSDCTMYVIVLGVAMFYLGILSLLMGVTHIINTVLAILGAVVMAFFIILDTQLILGSARAGIRRSATSRIEFTVDMYAFAAYQLYMDIIVMFLRLLKLLGQRR